MITLCLTFELGGSVKSHGVHEGALHTVEEHHAHDQQHHHEDEAVGQAAPAELAGTQEAVLEGLDDGGQGVEAHGQMKLGVGDGAQGPHHRRGIHPQPHEVVEHQLQVAILGGHAREEDAEAQRQARQHQHQHRQQQGVPVGVDLPRNDEKLVDGIHHQKQPQLDGESQQVAHHGGDGHHQPREVDLAEDARVGNESRRGLAEAVAEILPQAHAAEVEQGLRQPVGRNLGDAPEDHHVHQHRDGGLQDVPQGSEDGLLVLRRDVAPHEEARQVAVAPELLQVHLQQLLLGLDDGGPGVVGVVVGCCHRSYACRRQVPFNNPRRKSGGVCHVRDGLSKRASYLVNPS